MDRNNCILRRAVTTDIPAIMVIEQACFAEDSFKREQFVYLINYAKGWFYVIEYRSRVIGYISLVSNARTRYLRIYSIAVDADFRGKGLGRMLLEQAIKIAREHDMAKITLEVNISNYPAIELYKKNGFAYISVKENYYHDGADALYMQLSLG